jgi:hypothetical protein
MIDFQDGLTPETRRTARAPSDGAEPVCGIRSINPVGARRRSHGSSIPSRLRDPIALNRAGDLGCNGRIFAALRARNLASNSPIGTKSIGILLGREGMQDQSRGIVRTGDIINARFRPH